MAARRIDWDRVVAVLLILPSILAIGIFVYAFIAWTGWSSVLRWKDLLPLQAIPPFPQIFPPNLAVDTKPQVEPAMTNVATGYRIQPGSVPHQSRKSDRSKFSMDRRQLSSRVIRSKL